MYPCPPSKRELLLTFSPHRFSSVQLLNQVQLFATPWAKAHHAACPHRLLEPISESTVYTLLCLASFTQCAVFEMHPCLYRCMVHSFVLWVIIVLNVFVVVTPTTVTHQAPLSMGFPRQEYWIELPFPSPEDLPGPEIKPMPSACIFHIAGGSFPMSHQGNLP